MGSVREIDVIEELLLEQLREAIVHAEETLKKKKSCDKIALPKLLGLHKDCQDLKGLIENPKKGTGASDSIIRKENLYYLNNVMAELQLLLDKNNLLAWETIKKLVCDLRGRLQQIRKGLEEKKNLEGDLEEKKKLKGDLEEKKKAGESVQGGGTEASLPKDNLQAPKKAGSVNGGVEAGLPKGPPEVYRWSSRLVLPNDEGIEDKAMVMERLLVDKEGFKAIGIVGRAGVGKTTLCQKAFNKQEVKQHFIPRIWAFLSKQSSGKVDTVKYRQDLVKRTLMCLGFEDKVIDGVGQGGLCRLLFALRQQLYRRRYLIVLDDIVWNMEGCFLLIQDHEKKQDELGYGFPKRGEGAVIITSRSHKLAESMVGEKNLHRLLPLLADKQSCWEIFKDAVGEENYIETKEEEKKIIENEIVKKCAGLPLTARMLGQIKLDDNKKREKSPTDQQDTQKQEA